MTSAFPLSWSTEPVEVSTATLVVIDGDLDRQTAPALRDHLEWLIGSRRTPLILDARGVVFADTGAYELLTELGRRATATGFEVVLTAPSLALRRLLDVVGPPAGIAVDPARDTAV